MKTKRHPRRARPRRRRRATRAARTAVVKAMSARPQRSAGGTGLPHRPSTKGTSPIGLGRPWRKRTTSEKERPKNLVELCGDFLRIADEARGKSNEVRHVLAMLTCPLLLCFFAVLFSVVISVKSIAASMPGDIKPWAAVAILSASAWGVGTVTRKIRKIRKG